MNAVRGTLLIALALLVGVAAALTPQPFRATSEDLLRRFHAEIRPCPLPSEPEHVCFRIAAATVVDVAEALEAYVAERAGALERGPWSGANGSFAVTLTMVDRSWGKLEIWLVELPRQGVDGRFEHHPIRRE